MAANSSKPKSDKSPDTKSEEDNKKIHIGLIMPISSIDGCSSEHWSEVREIIKEAFPSESYHIDLVSESEDIGVIQDRIVNNIFNCDIAICDVSAKNANVMFELGLRLAFDKPAIVIKDEITTYSFDTSPLEHLEYPRSLHYKSISLFKEKLKSKVDATLKKQKEGNLKTFLQHFGQFQIATLPNEEVSASEFYIKELQKLNSTVSQLVSNQQASSSGNPNGEHEFKRVMNSINRRKQLFKESFLELAALSGYQSDEIYKLDEDKVVHYTVDYVAHKYMVSKQLVRNHLSVSEVIDHFHVESIPF